MNARPKKELLIEAAKIKDMRESFVEKDWFVTQVIKLISSIHLDGFEIVFSGGTALSKAHNLLFRFSEDVDFRLLCAEDLCNRKALSSFKHAVVDALRASGFRIEDHHVKARDENRFFSIDLEYESAFAREDALRPHIQIEMTARDIQLPKIDLPVSSFLNELAKQTPEVPKIGCINPVESAADKLSALAWRVPDRIRGGQYDDPSIVRHIHDLAMLKDKALSHSDFARLAKNAIKEDEGRAKNDAALDKLGQSEKLLKMLEILETDTGYKDEYSRFVEGVSYAQSGQTPDFDTALKAVRALVQAVIQANP